MSLDGVGGDALIMMADVFVMKINLFKSTTIYCLNYSFWVLFVCVYFLLFLVKVPDYLGLFVTLISRQALSIYLST